MSTEAYAEPTIYALSTASGRAAIAVIRISGPACLDVYRSLCPGRKDPSPRHAIVRGLYRPGETPSPDSILDSGALVLYFPGPRSVTGEDVLEFQVHGGPAIVRAVLAAISKCSSPRREIRYAEPGEFTRRAFLNNRLDLTQVEALGDTLSASTEQQRRLSVRGTTNHLAQRYEAWRHLLLYARGELEALIDFSEDQHFDDSPAELCNSVAIQVRALRRLVKAHAENAVRGELLRNGISVSLLGAPNAGKSSLLNCIVGREAAIVSQEAGTTRDVVEVGLDIGGYLCRIGDTAGLRRMTEQAQGRETAESVIGKVEQEGMRRAKQRASESEVVIAIVPIDETGLPWLDQEVLSAVSELIETKDNVLLVLNKVDQARTRDALQNAVESVTAALPSLRHSCIFPVSCIRAQQGPSMQADGHAIGESDHPASPQSSRADPGGIQGFLSGLASRFAELTAAVAAGDGMETGAIGEIATAADPSVWQESLGASERHRVLLEQCLEALDDFLGEVGQSASQDAMDGRAEADIVLAAEHLRKAAACLGKITGRGEAGDVEEVLGVVFEKFCVGK
ncbi:putative mitochondrial GTPase [Polychaeton citri CBS 116435]|uniref:Mitochondrial GTPase n=1 Tax=Polychaeton citri CBS 116435 TaxID=1314669 RepID=A0A9P4URG8_9PEZI|nr:putative mitochondrial GTPase [Polychaeton citri CBS 116435]